MTWNIGEHSASEFPADLLGLLGAAVIGDADMLVVSVQEANEERAGESEAVRDALLLRLGGGGRLCHIGSCTHRKTQLHVFAAPKVAACGVQTGSLNVAREGTSKTGSKGAAALSLSLGGGPSLCLVAAHLTSHPERLADRNKDARMILCELTVGGRRCTEHDHTILLGDLNSRTELAYADAEALVMASRQHASGSRACQAELDTLLAADQLRAEMAAGRTLPGFTEAPITFEPTYKWKEGKASPRVLVNKKGQAASYCDRVLLASSARAVGKARAVIYTAAPQVALADHTPVLCRFDLDVN